MHHEMCDAFCIIVMNKDKVKIVVRITVSIDNHDYEELSTIIEKAEVSMAWIIRRAIKEFLDSHNKDHTVVFRNHFLKIKKRIFCNACNSPFFRLRRP